MVILVKKQGKENHRPMGWLGSLERKKWTELIYYGGIDRAGNIYLTFDPHKGTQNNKK